MNVDQNQPTTIRELGKPRGCRPQAHHSGAYDIEELSFTITGKRGGCDLHPHVSNSVGWNPQAHGPIIYDVQRLIIDPLANVC